MDNICVAIRVRPINQREANATQQLQPWNFDESNVTLLSLNTGKPINTYAFDFIYNSMVPTQSLYDGVAKNIVKSSMDGINGTIFAYGQTSSGKTFTMKGNSEIPGIIPLAIKDIFTHIENSPSREFLLRVSYMEIYNEVIQDLLNPEGKNLKIHEDIGKGIYVGGIKEAIVVSAEQVLTLMQSGEDKRHVGATNMNEYSSRSHTIFRMVIESRERSAGGDRKSVDGAVKVSMLNLVDLAGSERIAHTGAEGIRQKEGGHINKSLLALSTVIAKLSEGQKQLHIPYRDSKLTRILQTALGGNARTAIICTVTPAAVHQEETLSTLKFATRAKNIKNKPIINEVVDEATMLRKYKDEIHTLKKQLAQREVVIEQKVEDNSAKQSELETLREQIDKLKGVIIHSSEPTQDTTRRRPKRNTRRETWCPGEAGAIGLGGVGMLGGAVAKPSEESSDDLAADIDKELGFGSYRIPDFPGSSFSVSRKRHFPTDSPVPLSLESSFGSDQPTPKQLKPLFTPEKPSFHRAEILLGAKKEPTPTKDSNEVIELRKEAVKQKAVVAELLATSTRLQGCIDKSNQEKQAMQQIMDHLQSDNEALRQELGKMMDMAKASYAESEDLRAQIEELQDTSMENWESDKAALEATIAESRNQLEKVKREGATMRESLTSLQQEVEALNEMLSESATETDSWKTRFADLQTEHDLAQANWAEREEELMAVQAETSNGDNAQKSEANAIWESKYNEVAAQLKELNEAQKEREEEFASLQEQHTSMMEGWQTKYMALHNEFEEFSGVVNQQREALESENSGLLEQVEKKDDEIDRLNTLLEEKGDANRSVLPEAGDSSELRASLDEATEECARLTALIQEQVEKISVMEKAAAEQAQPDEQEKATEELARLTALVQEQAEKISAMEKAAAEQVQPEEKEKMMEEIAERVKECERISGNLAEKEKECERLSQLASSVQVLQREHSNSLLQAAELRDQLAQAQQRLEAAKAAETAELSNARQEIASLTAQIIKIQQETAAQVAAQAGRCQQLEADLQNVTDKLNHQVALADSNDQRTKEAEREVQQHLDSLRALEGNATHSSKRAQQLQTSADLARQQCDSLSVKVAELTKEKQKLEAKLFDAERFGIERTELMESLAKLKNEVGQSTSAYERQREELVKAQQQVKRLQEAYDESSHELEVHKNLYSAAEDKALQSSNELQRLHHEAAERESAVRRDQILHTTQLEMKEHELERVASELAELQRETSELRRDVPLLAAAAKDYDRLTCELGQMKARYAADTAQWKEESLKMKKELKASSSTNSSAEKERDQLSREMEKLKQKMEVLDGKYKQATQSNCSLEADKVAAERELKQIRKQNADLERTNEKLKTTDNKSKETSASLAQLTKTYDTLLKTHEALVKTSDKLKFDLDGKSADLMKEIEVKIQLDLLLVEAKNELEAKTASIETLTREKNEETKLKKETDQVLLITVGKLDDTQRKLAEVEEKVQALIDELAESRKIKEQAEEEKDKLCGQLTEMHYAVEENRAEWSAKEFEFSKERETISAELSAIKEQLTQRDTSIEELKAQVEEKTQALQSTSAELVAFKEEVSKLQGEVAKLQEELVGTKEEAEKVQAGLEGARNEIANIQQELENSKTEGLRNAAALSEAANEDKKVFERTFAELQQAKEELKNAQGELINAREEINKAAQEVESLRTGIEERGLELNANKEWAEELMKQNEEVKIEYQRVQQQKKKLEEDIEGQWKDNEMVKEIARELETKAGGLEREVKGWRERAEQVEEESRMWQDRIREMQRIVEGTDGKVKEMKKENEELRKGVEEMKRDNDELRRGREERGREVRGGEEVAKIAAERDALRAEFEAYREEVTERETELNFQIEDYAKLLDKATKEAHEGSIAKDSQFKYQKKIKELLFKMSNYEQDAKKANAACAQKEIELVAMKGELERRAREDEGTLTKSDLLSEVARLEGVVNDLKAEMVSMRNAAEKQQAAKADLKTKMMAEYQNRKPLSECTNRIL